MLSWQSLNLKTVLLLLIALAITPAYVVILYYEFDHRSKATADALGDAQVFAQHVAKEQERVFNEARQFLAGLAQIPAIASFQSPANCSRQLADLKQNYPQYANAGVVRRDGVLHCSAIPMAKNSEPLRRSHFERAMGTRSFSIGTYETDFIANKPTVTAVYPLAGDARRPQGAVFVAIELGWLNDVLKTGPLPRGVTISVVDSDNKVLAHFPGIAEIPGEKVSDARNAPTRQLLFRSSGTLKPPDPNLSYSVYPLHASAGNKAYIRVGLAQDIIYSEINRSFYRSLLVIACMTLLFMVIAWKVADRLVVRRVSALADTAKRLGQGDLRARISGPLPAPRELGQLARTFDEMALGLETRQSQIERSAADLKRVNRALKTLLEGIRTLLDATEEPALLRKMCHVAVTAGGYRAASVCYVQDDAAKSVRVVAHAGLDRDLFADVAGHCAAGHESGFVVSAIVNRASTVTNELQSDRGTLSPRGRLANHEIACAIGLPLLLHGKAIGAIAIYDSAADGFDAEETAWLTELAHDLAMGIASLRLRTDHARADAALKRTAHYDPLTDLPNRAYLYLSLAKELAKAGESGRPLAVLHLSLVRLQEINEALGYQQGDELIKQTAARLTHSVTGEAVVARISEDEFSILLPDVDLDQAAPTAKLLLDTLDRPFELSGIEVHVRAHIGIAAYPKHGDDPEGLIRRAAVGVHDAQRTGVGYATHYGDPEREGLRRLALISDLRRAIESDQITLYYQPKIDARSGIVSGAEALVRWQHPTKGLIPPNEFISIAEQTGLIKTLTYRVLDLAMRRCFAWRKERFELPIAVNFAAENLIDSELMARLEQLKAKWGAPMETLQIEITESTLVENPQKATETLNHLSDMGIQVYIDDFGTGYSSLGYLATLPVNALKIDRSFVTNMTTDPDHMTIVSTIISMAHALNMKVVAEGVETAEQVGTLQVLKCDELQGFRYSPALPAAEFKQWVDRRRQNLTC